MADLRISQMPEVGSLGPTDILPVVQNGTNKAVSFEVLEDSLRVSNPSYEHVTSSASLLVDGVSFLQAGAGSTLGVLLPSGTNQTTKTLISAQESLSSVLVSVPLGSDFNQVELPFPGSTATLIFVNDRWYVLCQHQATTSTV